MTTPESRIRAIEEAQVFSERAVEELAAEVRALGKRIGELATRLAEVERRLREAAQDPDSSDEQ